MLQRLLRVLAGMTILAGCTLRETHTRCQTSAECGPSEQCYLKYCVSADAGDVNATPATPTTPTTPATPAQMPELESRDAGNERAPASTECGSASTQATELEGACCSAPAACYDGPEGTLGVGACKAGMRDCVAGKLAECSESTQPRSEACNNPGADDDCDGEVDNIAGRGESCVLSSGFGPCGEGRRDCVEGMDSLSCTRMGPTPAEACNAQDDDCDGQIDEDFDISTDRANCGMCGRQCSSAELCCGGTCLATAAASASGCPACSSQQPCAATASCCGGACRDMQRDRRHCGACGHSCEQAERCCGGTCKTSCD